MIIVLDARNVEEGRGFDRVRYNWARIYRGKEDL